MTIQVDMTATSLIRPEWLRKAVEGEIIAKAKWSAAYVNDLPDSAFLYIEPGGKKDARGRTTPRSLRHFPFMDKDGEVDLPHLRNALARIPQAQIPQAAKDRASRRASGLLAQIKKAVLEAASPVYRAELGWHEHGVTYTGGEAKILAGGGHQHLFMMDGRVHRTGYGGDHGHEGDGSHTHGLIVGETTYSIGGGNHAHDLGLTATGGGGHSHVLMIGGESYTSLTPAEIAEGIAAGWAGISFDGYDSARITIATTKQSAAEAARGGALAGEAGRIWSEHYLPRLGLGPHVFRQASEVTPKDRVIALGREAEAMARAAGAEVIAALAHPAAFAGHPERLARRPALIRKMDEVRALLAPSPAAGRAMVIKRADAPKRIVYGVVLSPYGVDAGGSTAVVHADGTTGEPTTSPGDWVPASVIEKMAHEYLSKCREVDLHHRDLSAAQVVESFVEPYPTPEDYTLAMKNEPHRATVRPFGSDVVRSGEWVMGVKLTDEEWAEYEAGTLAAYSIVGLAAVTELDDAEMPEVQLDTLASSQHR